MVRLDGPPLGRSCTSIQPDGLEHEVLDRGTWSRALIGLARDSTLYEQAAPRPCSHRDPVFGMTATC